MHEEMGNFIRVVETREKNHMRMLEMKDTKSQVNSLYKLSS